MSDFNRTEYAKPPVNEPIEWLEKTGHITKGTYCGGLIWYPEGSDMYIYYVPEYWRLRTSNSKEDRK